MFLQLYVGGNVDGTILMYNFGASCPISAYSWTSSPPPTYHMCPTPPPMLHPLDLHAVPLSGQCFFVSPVFVCPRHHGSVTRHIPLTISALPSALTQYPSRFSPCGSSFSACNGTGAVGMWHFSPWETASDSMSPYLTWQAHSKRCQVPGRGFQGAWHSNLNVTTKIVGVGGGVILAAKVRTHKQDLCFVDCMTILATVGTYSSSVQASERYDVAVWDSLLPPHRRKVASLNNFGEYGGKRCALFLQCLPYSLFQLLLCE